MLNKNLNGIEMPKALSDALQKAEQALTSKLAGIDRSLEDAIYEVSDEIFDYSKPIISIQRGFTNYYEWAKTMPQKHGFDFVSRFDFWAETTKGLEGVAFMDKSGFVVIPLYRDDIHVHSYVPALHRTERFRVSELMPLFPQAVNKALESNTERMYFKVFQACVARVCDEREKWLASVNVNVNSTLRPSDDAIDAIGIGNDNTMWKNAWVKGGQSMFFTKEMLENAKVIKEESTVGKEDMSKTEQVKTGMVNVNKEALKSVAYLNAGRASNKVIKEACRPLLNAMFKPTFMQRIAMKLFKMENPVDVALKSGLSDLLCAQLAQAVVEIKGVDNEYVREVTKAGITQAGYELSKAIPFEKAIDELVSKLTVGAESIGKTLKK